MLHSAIEDGLEQVNESQQTTSVNHAVSAYQPSDDPIVTWHNPQHRLVPVLHHLLPILHHLLPLPVDNDASNDADSGDATNDDTDTESSHVTNYDADSESSDVTNYDADSESSDVADYDAYTDSSDADDAAYTESGPFTWFR